MVLHLRSSHDHVAGDLGSQTLHQRHRQGQTHQGATAEGGKVERVKACRRAEAFVSLAASYLPEPEARGRDRAGE